MRPVTQKQRQTEINTFGNSRPVPRASLLRSNLRDQQNQPAAQSRLNSAKGLKSQVQNYKYRIKASAGREAPAQTALLARRLPMDMSLPGEESPSRIGMLIRQTKWHRVRLHTTRGLAFGLVVLILFGAFFFSNSYTKLHKIFMGDAPTAEALKPNVPLAMLNGQSSGRVNVLLLGRDGGGHSNPDVTNTVMLASIDTINHTTTLLSLPSDLWVNSPDASVMKLNAAWQAGEFNYLGGPQPGSTNAKAIQSGYKVVDQAVGQVTGLTVNYNILVNTQAIEQAVNNVGGVTVNVPSTLVDPTMAWENNRSPLIAESGTQNFNGKQAFLYMTSKETTSDSARNSRQRQVLVALFNKIVSADTYSNPVKLEGLINTFGNNITTDLSMKNAGLLFNIINQISPSSVNSIDLDTPPNQFFTNGNVNGEAVELPQAGLFNYSAIQQYLKLQLKNPYIVKENAKVLILNGTSTAGLATNMGNQLSTEGYNVIGEANTPNPSWTNTSLFNISGSNKYTQHFLAQKLGVKVSKNKLSNSIPNDGANFVIIIGSNEANNTQT